ncbi:serine/threonine-protein kinase [Actinomadura nitritigenes]|uniref:serine/threonine-protein kinase n=1 Tax=Actinomadura nitritigenes TaxID=134602 RepID=UPI003D8D88F7
MHNRRKKGSGRLLTWSRQFGFFPYHLGSHFLKPTPSAEPALTGSLDRRLGALCRQGLRVNPLGPDDPQTMGRYSLTARLGSGGMGTVYLGLSPGGRPVAVKIVRAEYGNDPEFRRRFATEITAAKRVGGFYTAHVVDADPYGDPPWMVTAYVDGPSLYQTVIDQGPLPLDRVARLGAGLVEALGAIHGCGLVHRDLKPTNILIASDGPRVIDFGIARALEVTSTTTTSAIVGTPAYMSPEQILAGRQIGPPSDVFSLGSVLTFAATGTVPFGVGHPQAVLFRIVQDEPDLSQVPIGIRDIVAACLAKQPALRPTLGELLTALSADGGTVTADWPPRPAAETINRHVTPTGTQPSSEPSRAAIPEDSELPAGLRYLVRRARSRTIDAIDRHRAALEVTEKDTALGVALLSELARDRSVKPFDRQLAAKTVSDWDLRQGIALLTEQARDKRDDSHDRLDAASDVAGVDQAVGVALLVEQCRDPALSPSARREVAKKLAAFDMDAAMTMLTEQALDTAFDRDDRLRAGVEAKALDYARGSALLERLTDNLRDGR